jgi:UDP:flavonoid glycosyltransferase YjiC (YdhE family)
LIKYYINNNMSTQERLLPPPGIDVEDRDCSWPYELRLGAADTLEFDPEKLDIYDNLPETVWPLPNVHFIGNYLGPNENGETENIPVIAFPYYNPNSEKPPIKEDRVIIYRGFGCGVHQGHIGQERSWYLVGPQIGTIDQLTGRLDKLDETEYITSKHFSTDCIVPFDLALETYESK